MHGTNDQYAYHTDLPRQSKLARGVHEVLQGYFRPGVAAQGGDVSVWKSYDSQPR